jgi:UDP-glucose 6-dehydrogenase
VSRVAIFGAGYAGLVTGVGFAELGHDVVVRDVIPERIAALVEGRTPFHEPGLDELLERNRERLRFTSARRPHTPATPTCRRSGPSSTSCRRSSGARSSS